MEEEERTFTAGQAEAFEALRSGRNVFLSGNAGTGKSYVLNAFIEELLKALDQSWEGHRMTGVPLWQRADSRRVEDMEDTTFQLYWHYSMLYR